MGGKPGLLFRSGRFIRRASAYRRELGWKTGLRWFCAKIVARLPGSGRTGRIISIRPRSLEFPVLVRMLPSSDDYLFDQVFTARDYEPLRRIADPKFILDLGANTGYVSALLATWHPGAHILAVEPEPANYRQCVENLKPYGDRVQTFMGAVWSRCTQLALRRGDFGDGLDWAAQVAEPIGNEPAPVEGWDMEKLLQLAGEDRIDLLKIDIEGSEAELFSFRTDWLRRVRNICIELHDQRCRDIFFEALKGYDFDVAHDGEHTLCFNLKPAPTAQIARSRSSSVGGLN